MSYSIYLIDPADACNQYDVGNYTSNVSPMWSHALAQSGATARLLSDLDNTLAKEVGPILSQAICHMAVHPEQYEHMEPDNGWGSFDGALLFLVRFHKRCRQYPEYRVMMSY